MAFAVRRGRLEVRLMRLSVLLLLLVAGAVGCMPPSWAANALLHPPRRPVTQQPRAPFEVVEIDGAGVRLKGWWFRAAAPKRGTIVYLHGVADSRGSGIGVAEHFVARGFDVIAYDSRAHGESGGDACTYGYYEKQDLGRVLDRVDAKPVVLIGFSLGAAVALQAAAGDARIKAVIAVSSFSDLRTVGSERAPFFASRGNIAEAFQMAEREGKFRVDDVSPVAAAPRIAAPVLLVHGERDDETPAAHSQRIFAALPAPHRRLVVVQGAGHGNPLTADVWRQLDAWVDDATH
jgi:pimeloyl-ACP methyl ester carboxylesterase